MIYVYCGTAQCGATNNSLTQKVLQYLRLVWCIRAVGSCGSDGIILEENPRGTLHDVAFPNLADDRLSEQIGTRVLKLEV